VPVAVEVASQLVACLDVVLVRKLGAPMQRELAIGAVVDGASPQIVLNRDIVAELGVNEAFIQSEAERQLEVIEQRRKKWLADRPCCAIAGKTVIIVDDGIATGATMRAAVVAVRRNNPARIVVAVPVAPRETVAALHRIADDVVVLETPEPFGAIGFFYRDFSQVSDDEVTDILSAYPHVA